MQSFDKSIVSVLGVLLLIIVVQSFIPWEYRTHIPEPEPEVECMGEPIAVDFPFNGGVNEPWTCQVQCTDQKPHFILYTNGKATQCETLPGCNDTGEDRGVTCTPPVTSEASS